MIFVVDLIVKKLNLSLEIVENPHDRHSNASMEISNIQRVLFEGSDILFGGLPRPNKKSNLFAATDNMYYMDQATWCVKAITHDAD